MLVALNSKNEKVVDPILAMQEHAKGLSKYYVAASDYQDPCDAVRGACCTDSSFPVLGGIDMVYFKMSGGKVAFGDAKYQASITGINRVYTFWFVDKSYAALFQADPTPFLPRFGGFYADDFCASGGGLELLMKYTAEIDKAQVWTDRIIFSNSPGIDLEACEKVWYRYFGIPQNALYNTRCVSMNNVVAYGLNPSLPPAAVPIKMSTLYGVPSLFVDTHMPSGQRYSSLPTVLVPSPVVQSTSPFDSTPALEKNSDAPENPPIETINSIPEVEQIVSDADSEPLVPEEPAASIPSPPSVDPSPKTDTFITPAGPLPPFPVAPKNPSPPQKPTEDDVTARLREALIQQSSNAAVSAPHPPPPSVEMSVSGHPTQEEIEQRAAEKRAAAEATHPDNVPAPGSHPSAEEIEQRAIEKREAAMQARLTQLNQIQPNMLQRYP